MNFIQKEEDDAGGKKMSGEDIVGATRELSLIKWSSHIGYIMLNRSRSQCKIGERVYVRVTHTRT